MKRSVFVGKQIDRVMDLGCGPARAATIAHEIARDSEAAGVKWDPGEPELPKRLKVTVLPTGLPVLEWDGFGCGYETRVHFCEAAADAYNRLQAGELVPLPVATEEILKLIKECDDLKQALSEVANRCNAQADHIRQIRCAVEGVSEEAS